MCEQKQLEAIDALNKIAALTRAALYLHHGEEEEDLALHLMDIVLQTARKCVEVDHDA